MSSAADILDDKGQERSAKSISPVRIYISYTMPVLFTASEHSSYCLLCTFRVCVCVCVFLSGANGRYAGIIRIFLSRLC